MGAGCWRIKVCGQLRYALPKSYLADCTLMTTLYRGRFLSLKKSGTWEYCSRENARAVVAVVAITDEGRLLLTQQHRPPLGADAIELPAGLVGDDEGFEHESLSSAARRELEEECGYRAETLRELTHGPTSGGLTDEVIHFFHATELSRTGDGGGVDGEDITVHAVALEDIDQFMADRSAEGMLIDPKVYAGLYFLKGQLPDG